MQSFCSLVIVYFLTSSLGAETLFLQPPSLEEGDRYRLIFVTSEKRNGTASNIEVYNRFVQSVADSAPVISSWGLDWSAVVSTRTVDARENIGYSDESIDDLVPIFRVNGEMITNLGFPALFTTNLEPAFLDLDPVLINEFGEVPPESGAEFDVRVPVWTGTRESGVGFTGNEIGRVSGGATIGDATAGFTLAFNRTSANIQNPFHFYAISEVLTAVPEPDAGLIFMWATPVLLWILRVRITKNVGAL